MADLKSFADQLVALIVKEVNELAKILKDEYGIEPAAAAVAIAAGPQRELRPLQPPRENYLRCHPEISRSG